MAPNQIRSFIAVDLSPEVLSNIEQLTIQLKKRIGISAVRWVPGNNIHLTLKFLGDVPAHQVDEISSLIQAAATEQSCFNIDVEHLGAFPKINQPRVIWVGMKHSAELLNLQEEINKRMAWVGVSRETRPFTGHLTLGRVSERCQIKELVNVTETIRDFQAGQFGRTRIEMVHLYQSDLQPAGPVYTRLFTANFRHDIPEM